MSEEIVKLIKKRAPLQSGSLGADIKELILTSVEPFVVPGAICDWPSVKAANRSAFDLSEYLKQFDSGQPVISFAGSSALKGRIFYNADFTGLNCQRRESTLSNLLTDILAAGKDEDAPPLTYLGSTPIRTHLPDFDCKNGFEFLSDNADAYIWIGGPSRISAHYDFSENLACVVAGKRRFILFPPDQLKNLYVGPLDFSPAGQPISLVDFHEPDLERFPRFREALQHAMIANLEPGDAIFIPSMWQHHVEALSPVNVLVNYWFQRAPKYLGAPMNALEHAMMTLRDLPPEQKGMWREIFDHYVFQNDEGVAEHIPKHMRGILNSISPEDARKIRATLLNRLNS